MEDFVFCHFFPFVPLVKNQLEKRTTPYIPSSFHYAWARLFTTEAQSTRAPFHPKHTAQPADPLSLPAGPASTAVIILRTAQVESDCREIPPPPSCSEIVHLASSQPAHFPAHLWTVLTLLLPPPQPLLPAATGCSSTTPPELPAPGTGVSQQGQELPSFTPCAGKATRCWPPSLQEEARNLPALLQKPGTEREERGVRGSSTPSYSLCPKSLPSSRHSRMQQAAGREPGLQRSSPERGQAGGPLPCWLGFLEQKHKESVTERGCTYWGWVRWKGNPSGWRGEKCCSEDRATARGRHWWTKEMTGRKNMQDARGKNMEG